jgi:nucleotide-binding universal stress UspA family protein
MNMKKIIVAVSLEKETADPLQKIKLMDISPETEIHLVHIVPVILYARGMQFSVLTYPTKEERPQVEEAIVHKLQAVASDLFPQHKDIIYKCLFDSNEKAAFCDYVKEQKADLVVVATRGRHGLTTVFDSSFAQHQLKYSPTNVLILR